MCESHTPTVVLQSHSSPDPLNLVLQREQTREKSNSTLPRIPEHNSIPTPDAISPEVILEEVANTTSSHSTSISSPSHNTLQGSSRWERSFDRSSGGSSTPPIADLPLTPPPEPTSVSRYGCIRKMTYCMRAYKQQVSSVILVIFEDEPSEAKLVNPITVAATSNPDTTYFDQAMQQEDSEEFLQAVVKEMNNHISRKHWQLTPRSSVPKGIKILPSQYGP